MAPQEKKLGSRARRTKFSAKHASRGKNGGDNAAKLFEIFENYKDASFARRFATRCPAAIIDLLQTKFSRG
jgi:hypothetical protein